MILDVFEKLDGMLTILAQEKKPLYLFTKIVNWQIAEKIGRFIKRKPYANKKTTSSDSNLTNIKGMVEYTNKSDATELVVQTGTSLRKLVVTAGTYANSTAISGSGQDERTSGSTMNTYYPLSIHKSIRSGAGITASTQRPWWYGYIYPQNRFNDNTSIVGNSFLYDQYPHDWLDTLFTNPYLATGTYGNRAIGVIPQVSSKCFKTGEFQG